MKKSGKRNNTRRASSRGLDKKRLAELAKFTEYHSAHRLSRNLRTLLMEFLSYEGATEARYLQDLLHDLQGLFEFLEAIQQLDDAPGK